MVQERAKTHLICSGKFKYLVMNCKFHFDVIVIGAGPAGATAAYLLASHGYSVLILDKSTFPRSKLCGGLLTWKTVKLLENIFQITTDFLKSIRVITCNTLKYKVVSSTGTSLVLGSDFRARHIWKPLSSGIATSDKIKSGA